MAFRICHTHRLLFPEADDGQILLPSRSSHECLVLGKDLLGAAIFDKFTVIDPQYAGAQISDCSHVVRDDDDRTVLIGDELLHLVVTLFLETGIAHTKDFVDQNDVCFQKINL